MKNLFSKIIMSFMVLAVVSCGDDILDINTSPNNPETSTPAFTLPAGQVGIASRLGFDYNLLGSMLIQHWTQGPTASQYSFIDQYNITTNNYAAAWSTMYATALKDLDFVRDESLATGDNNTAAVAQLLMSYTFQILVDLYDRIPYTEALQGKEGVLAPNYDNGSDVYDDLIVKVDEALSWIDLSGTATRPTTDIIYGGNMSTWIKFGNTLKLKIYIRQAEARASVAQAGIQAMETAGAEFLGLGEDAMVNFSANTQNENPLWQNLNQTTFQNLVASETSVNFYINNADPRIDFAYDAAPNVGSHVGLTQGTGVTSGDVYDDFSHLSAQNVNGEASGGAVPVVFISAIESLFLQAEAAQRGFGSGDPQSLYEQAVSASFSAGGFDASTYLAAGGTYEYDGTLEQLITQKWAASNGVAGLEAWNDWRRTGFPDFIIESVTSNLPAGQFPLRLIWPSTERDNNPNTPELVSLTTAVWWDVD